MLQLKQPSLEPYWMDLVAGVRLQVRPPSTALMLMSKNDAHGAIKGEEASSETTAKFQVAWGKSLAKAAIVDWEGIGDAGGAPAPVTPENIELLMENYAAFSAFDREYMTPAMLLDSEKNA